VINRGGVSVGGGGERGGGKTGRKEHLSKKTNAQKNIYQKETKVSNGTVRVKKKQTKRGRFEDPESTNKKKLSGTFRLNLAKKEGRVSAKL